MGAKEAFSNVAQACGIRKATAQLELRLARAVGGNESFY